MIKVMQFIPGLTMGGAETLVKDYCLNFDKTKIDLVLLCSIKRGTPYEKTLEYAGIKVIYIDDYTTHIPNILMKVLIHFTRYLKVRKIIKNEKPDVIHFHLGLGRLVKFSKTKCKLFYTVHNTPDFVWKNKKEERAIKWLIKYRNMQLIALHEKMRCELNSRFHIDNTVVINNGIDFDKFNITENKESIRKSLQLPIDAVILGHIGRFREEKNHDFLVEIFNEYKKLNPKAFLLLIGDGILKNEIIKKLETYGLKDSYLLLSNRTDVPRLMKCMDYFLLPSKVEGLPVVLVEAQKTGLKCIVSKEAVPIDVQLSNYIIYKSITESPKEWANYILKKEFDQLKYYDIENWNMKNIIIKLQNLYSIMETDNC